jgi:hypothetical protein
MSPCGGRPGAKRRFYIPLDAIYVGLPFNTALPDLGLISNQVWGLCKTSPEWSAALDAALTVTCRDDLRHGTTPAYGGGASAKTVVSTNASEWRPTAKAAGS